MNNVKWCEMSQIKTDPKTHFFPTARNSFTVRNIRKQKYILKFYTLLFLITVQTH